MKKAMYIASPRIPGEPRAWDLRVGREEMCEEVVTSKIESQLDWTACPRRVVKPTSGCAVSVETFLKAVRS